MTLERVKRLIDCYGGSPNAWPEEEREAAQALFERHSTLQSYAEPEAQLDAALKQAELFVSPEDVELTQQRILQNLPAQHDGQKSTQATVTVLRDKWRSVSLVTALAASLVVALFLWHPTRQANHSSELAQIQFEKWAWNDTVGHSISSEEDAGLGVNTDSHNLLQVGMLEMGFAPEELNQP